MKIDIKECCKNLEGMIVHDIKDYGGILRISFKSKGYPYPKYAIQIICNWRIKNEHIILGYRDLLMTEDCDWQYELPKDEFVSRFEKRIASIKRILFNNCKVTSVNVDKFMDIEIKFNNGYTLTTFRDSKLKENNWSIINYETNKTYSIFESGE